MKCIRPAPVAGDNACKINKTALLKMVENRNCELIYANFSNDLDIKPYGVFIDKDREVCSFFWIYYDQIL